MTEDAFWQVWRQAPRFDPERGSALAWILTIARSPALDAIRSRTRAKAVAESQRVAPTVPAASLQDDFLDLLAAMQQGHRLYAALANLDPEPRRLIALAFFQDLSRAGITHNTSLSLGAVKSHIRRALIRLR